MTKCATAAVALLVSVSAFASELPANQWVKLSEGGIGPKFSPGMVYSPQLKRFVLIGGAIGRYPTGGPFPYDVLSAAPGGGVWRNEFPQGSGWTPEAGPAKVPAWKGYGFSAKDEKGNVRPHMRHTVMYNQYCLDTDGNCVWAIIADHTMRLDLATMKWEDLGNPSAWADPEAKRLPRGLKWASMCYDPVEKEVLLFGGAHRQPQPGAWMCRLPTKERGWDVVEAQGIPEFQGMLLPLRSETVGLAAALRNRLHRTETAAAAKVDLAAAAQALDRKLRAFTAKSRMDSHDASAAATGYVRNASGALAEGRRRLAAGDTAQALLYWNLAVRATEEAGRALLVFPPPRLMAPMAFDPKGKGAVMFGGDRWDRVCNETWEYNSTGGWQRTTSGPCPSPRAGHALLYLPKSGKVLLFGGYTYRTSMSYSTNLYEPVPFDMWIYDPKWMRDSREPRWQRIKFAGKPPLVSCIGRAPVAVAGAASDDDVVQVIGLGKTLSTWAIRIEPTPDAEQPKTGSFEETRRGLCFDPKWFDEAVTTAKPDDVAAKLAALPANKWVAMSPPKRLFNRDWGTQVFDFDRDQILHWTGGHSAYCGTAPAHYSVKLNRWSIGFAPELPMEHTYDAGVGGSAPASTFTGRPFAPHTYKSYCYDPATKKLVWLHESKVWVYDPDRREWEAGPKPTPFYAERHTTVACPTPHGIAAWAVPAGKGVYHGWRGMWLLTELKANTWKTLVKPDKTSIFPTAYGDRHGMCYDAKRDRLYLFHFGLKHKHKIAVYDFKTAKAEVMEPRGAKGFPADASVAREPVYVPEQDVVFIASRAKGPPATLLYDPAKNAWLKMEPTFEVDKRGRAIRPSHGVSTGVMWDPNRKCLWASDARGQVYAMKFDRRTANVKELDK